MLLSKMDNGWKPSSDGPKSMEGCGLDLSGSRGRERSEKVGGNRWFDDLADRSTLSVSQL